MGKPEGSAEYSRQDTTEAPILNDLEQRVAELYAPSAETAAQWRPELRRVVDRAIATTLSEHERKALALAGGILEWQLFDPTQEPPKGVVMAVRPGSGPYISYDYRMGVGLECMIATMKKLEGMGLSDVVQAVQTDIEGHKDVIKSTLGGVVETMPEFGIIQAFGLDSPIQFQEQPLDDYWQQVRHGQVAGLARQQHGRDYAHEFRQNPKSAAAQRHNRAVRGIDDETMLRPADSPDVVTATDRAMAHFLPLVKADFTKETGDELARFENIGGTLQAVGRRGRKIEVSYFFSNTAVAIVNSLGKSDLVARFDARRVLAETFLVRLYDPSKSGESYADKVRAVVSEAAERIHRTSVEDLGSNSCCSGGYGVGHYRLLRSAGVTAALPWSMLRGKPAADSCRALLKTPQRPGFTTREALDLARSKVLGRVVHSPEERHARRIIRLTSRDESIPMRHQDEDLQIYLPHADFCKEKDPSIPGYILTSRFRELYGFVKDPDGDPYAAPSNVLLTDGQRLQMSGQFAAIGLGGLAQEVMASSGLSVQGLRSMVKFKYSRYIKPETVTPGSDVTSPVPESFEAASIADYARFVQEGCLELQCDGIDEFLRFALDDAFGVGSTSKLGGYVIGRDGKITSSQHAQTIFSYGGRVYILDATPSSSPSGPQDGSNSSQDDHSFGLSPVVATADEIRTLVARCPVEEPPRIFAERMTSQLELAQRSLEAQLGIFFGLANREALLEKVASLNEDDPVRRTLSAVMLSARDQLPPGQTEDLISYLRLYSQADSALLAEINMPNYDPKLLEQLVMASEYVQKYDQARAAPPFLCGLPASSATGVANVGELKRSLTGIIDCLPSLDELEVARIGLDRVLDALHSSVGSAPGSSLGLAFDSTAAAQQNLAYGIGGIVAAIQGLERYLREI